MSTVWINKIFKTAITAALSKDAQPFYDTHTQLLATLLNKYHTISFAVIAIITKMTLFPHKYCFQKLLTKLIRQFSGKDTTRATIISPGRKHLCISTCKTHATHDN